ncbi:tetratricopeptide repeat protein [Streptomyces sp. NPDC058955]|uniref:tetratricopeptide repeat protein n=1 Tax=unclassified Streptomyces TaxID=2593676 RepID=UPI0036638014
MNEQGRTFYDQLRALEKRAEAACRRAGRPYSRRETEHSLRVAPYHVKLSGQRISDWLPDDPSAARTPGAASSEKVWALVRLWSQWAGEEPREHYWRTLLDRAHSTHTVRATRTSPGHPVGIFTDPFALEVHKAIEAESARAGSLPVLPPYIARAHDVRLRAIVREALDGLSRVVVLVGGSSTGKTRACWEALKLLPDDWRLWHPIDPSRPEAALAEMQDIGPRTVVWLNEAQHYLLTQSSDIGERVAAGLRELLRDPGRGPVLVLGTIWPEYWGVLTAPPDPSDRSREDSHAQARMLLAGHQLPVPTAFTDQNDIDALRAAAAADPRLAYAAARAEEGQVTQYLAGGPALLEQYHTAPDAARALMDAAIDARRLGLGPSLPSMLLEAAAGGYLTDSQWDLLPDHWFEEAVAYAVRPVRGARGALTRVRSRQGDIAAAHPRFRLADYLEQHGSRGRAAVSPPAMLWSASSEHMPASEHAELAEKAAQRGLWRISYGLYRNLAVGGDTDAMDTIVDLLSAMGRCDEALAWRRYATASGHVVDIRAIADSLSRFRGYPEEALFWYRLLASERETIALPSLVRLLAGMGRTDEAVAWNLEAAKAGVPVAARELAEQAAVEGRSEDALTWYRCMTEHGDGTSLRGIAAMLVRLGRNEEALTLLQERAEADDVSAMGETGWLLAEWGRPEEALIWFRRAVAKGDRFAYRAVARMLARTGRTDEARLWYRRAADEAHDPFALEEARQLNRPVQEDRETVWGGSTQADYFFAVSDVSLLLATEHSTPVQLDETEFSLGHDDFARTLRSLVLAGRDGGAFDVLGKAADEWSVDQVLALLREHRLVDQAVLWCQSRGASGSSEGDWWGTAHRLLSADGRTDEAERLRRYGWEPDGSVASDWEALPPESALRANPYRRHEADVATTVPASLEGSGPPRRSSLRRLAKHVRSSLRV